MDSALIQQWRPAKNEEEWENILWLYSYKGYHYLILGDIIKSTKAYEKTEQIYEQYCFKDYDPIELLYKPLGNNYTQLGDNEKARSIFFKSLQLKMLKDSPDYEAGIYGNIGISYWNEGDNKKAIDFFKKGLQVDKIPIELEGMLLTNMASSYIDERKDSLALDAAQKANEQFSNIIINADNKYILANHAKALDILASTQIRNKDYKIAEQNLQKALSLITQVYGKRHRQIAKLLNKLGYCFNEQMQYQKAIEYYNQALNTLIPSFQINDPFTSLPNEIDLYEENALFEALGAKANCLFHLFQESKNDLNLLKTALACHDLAQVVESKLRTTYQNESAKLSLQKSARKRVENAIRIAHILYQKTNDQQYLLHAFQNTEHSKSQVLLEALNEHVLKQQYNLGDSLLITEQLVKQQRNKLKTDIFQAYEEEDKMKLQLKKIALDEQLEEIQSAIKKAYPKYWQYAKNLSPITFDVLEQELLIDTNTILLSYFLTKEQLFLFAFRKGERPLFLNLDYTGNLNEAISSYVKLFHNKSTIANAPDAFFEQSHTLFQQLLTKKIDQYLVNSDQLIFIPDGILNYLPFETLISKSSTNPSFSNAEYLIKTHAINYAYSATILHFQNKLQYNNQKSLLSIAPVFSSSQRGLAPLKNSLSDFSFANSTTLNEGLASLVNFKDQAAQFSIIHLSTHAQATQKILPSIEFIDSTLFLPELYNLPLNASLVSLSACQTNLGEIEKGEGVMSLARGFAFAGAKSLVASLWTVDEQSTSHLFQSFYSKLADQKTTAKALQETKLDYLNNQDIRSWQKSPYYWAGFTLTGCDDTIDLKKKSNYFQYLIGMISLVFIIVLLAFFHHKYSTK